MATLPEGLNIEQLKSRHKRAFDIQSTWQPLLSDAYEFFIPQQNVWRFQNLSPGQRRDTRILDSTSEDALDVGASKVKAFATPDFLEWALLRGGSALPPELKDDTELLGALKEITTAVFDEIKLSNFSVQIGEAYKDWLIGTAAVEIRENTTDGESFLNFHTQNQQLIAYEEGALGNVESTFKFRETAARNVETAYPGGDFSTAVREKIKNDAGGIVRFLENVVRHRGEYWSIVIEHATDQLVWAEFQGRHNPVVVFRFAVMADEVRGRGPAMSQLPNARTLNKVQEFALQKAALDLSGMYTGVDDGVFNPNTMQISPGIVVPVASNASGNPSLVRLDTGSDLNLTIFEVERIENAIKKALFDDLRDPSDPVLTLGEVTIEARKLLKKDSSAFSRLHSEGLVPMLNRILEIMKRRGRIPDLPSINGREIDVKFTSPLAKAQDFEELESLQLAVTTTAEIAGPEMVHLAFKTDEIGEFIAKKTGMDPSLIRSEGERKQIQEATLEAAQAITQDDGQPAGPTR